jgi:hypothetical protein
MGTVLLARYEMMSSAAEEKDGPAGKLWLLASVDGWGNSHVVFGI